MSFMSSLDENAVGPQAWMLHPKAYAAWPAFAEAIMRSESEFNNGEKELIGAYSSAMRGCQHCYTAHYPVAVAYGVDPRLFEDIMQDLATAPVTDKLKPVLMYVRKLCREPHKLMQEDVDAILAVGWSESAVTDIVMMCGLFGFMNTMMHGYGAAEIDLTDIGPIHAIVRTKADYGHGEGSGREDPSLLIAESVKLYGEEATAKAVKRYKELGFLDAGKS